MSQVWDNLTAGRSGVGPIRSFDASHFPVRIAAEVGDWSLADVGLCEEPWEAHAPQTRFAIGAALKAAQSTSLADSKTDPQRLGVFLGCGEVFPDFDRFTEALSEAVDETHFALDRFLEGYATAAQPQAELILEPGVAVSAIAGLLEAEGPSANFTNACVSAATAIGEATEVIRRGDADIMLAGGAHSMIHPSGITGFHRLSTLSTRNDDPQAASRPFDRDRDGFVVGEGAAVVVLEDARHAKRRGAEIWAEVTGYGSTHDAYRVTDPRPDARGAARCMELALEDAQRNVDDIDYINAPGSGTVANDKVETAAIKRTFGPQAYRTAISSTKSMTGHLTTACGGLELLICALAIRHQVLPPTINYQTPDPQCDLDYVPNQARPLRCRHVLNNNFGFGGQNVSLVLSHFGR